MQEISRSNLIDMAQESLDRAKVRDRDLRIDVMNVAATVQQITAEWWLHGPDCGCLIGTLRTRRGQEAYVTDRGPELEIGQQFFRAMKERGLDTDRAYAVADPIDSETEQPLVEALA